MAFCEPSDALADCEQDNCRDMPVHVSKLSCGLSYRMDVSCYEIIKLPKRVFMTVRFL